MRRPLILLAMLPLLMATACPPIEAISRKPPPQPAAARAALAAAIGSPSRTPANIARDRYRHPMETLSFFDVRPEHVVVEFYPGGGWYSEILGPLVRDRGRYIAVVPEGGRGLEAMSKFISDRPQMFGPRATIVTFNKAHPSMFESGTADRVLTFRNVHNLVMDGEQAAANAFAGFYKVLKPGGVLGVVDHRLPETADPALERTSGYVKQSTVTRLAEAAGFRWDRSSEINANPLDTKDHPNGVWSLPPTYRGKDVDRARFQAIGESDRMTLRFVKPRA